MNAAEKLLQQYLKQNQTENYSEIDRSPQAVAERRRYQHYLLRKKRLEGIAIPSPESLEARLTEHLISGDISPTQFIAIIKKENNDG